MSSFSAPLSVTADVQAVLGAHAVRVTAARNRITVDLPGVGAGLAALRGSGGKRGRANALARLDTFLRTTDLSVRIRMAGGTLAFLGAEARPGWLSRLLGVAPLEVRLSGVMATIRGLWFK